MKVLYLLHTTAMCGSTISFINMARGLHRRGVKIYIAYPDRTMDQTFYDLTKDIVEKYYYVKLKSHTVDKNYKHQTCTKKIKQFLKEARGVQWLLFSREDGALLKVAEQIKPDLIHTNVGTLQAGYHVALRLNIPHIWHLREYQTEDFNWEILPDYDSLTAMLNKSFVITITEGIKKYFKLDHSSKVRCIYDGCADASDVVFEYPKKKYFFCCSRVSEEKGQNTVITAFSSFYKVHPEYELIIAGFGAPEYIRRLTKQAAALKCAEAIKFIGFRRDVKELMSKATALIVASRFEGFGMMTAEAAFYGCIVIGHNTGGTKEILDMTGGLPYETERELTARMVEAADFQKEQYEKAALKAQEAAVNRFSIDRNVSDVYEFYCDILKQHQKKSCKGCDESCN